MRIHWFTCAAIVLVAGVQSTAVPSRDMRDAAPRTSARAVQTMVPAGADLQGYINRARPGDVLLLEPGATYTGNFTLPAFPPEPANVAAQFITVRSAADDSHFPAGGRVDPSHLQWMPIVRSPNSESALTTKAGAHHWRLQWLAFQANAEGVGNIISLGDGGDGQRDLAAVPHHLQLDGVIIRGDAAKGQKRAIGLNSAETTIRNSDIRDIKADGQDSQAICGWNGPGPFVIENNYLEAAGENVMFGGADPTIRDLVPTDITIRRNYFTKPLEWRGSRWTVKNLLELKNARRVLIESNVFENNWVAAQTGYALLFKPTNQDGRAPWVEVTDVTFQFNIVRHSSSAISINGTDYQYPSGQLRRLQIKDNVFYDIDAARWGGEGRFLKIGDSPQDVVVDHNTAIQSGSVVQLYGSDKDGRPRAIEGFHLTNNLTLHNEYGIIGDSAGVGNSAIAAYLSHGDIRRNVLAGGDPSRYPADNLFPSVSEFMSQFVDSAQNNYRLRDTSRYRSAGTDGLALGANIDELSRRKPPEREPRSTTHSK
jgi:Right handed beta helix region